MNDHIKNNLEAHLKLASDTAADPKLQKDLSAAAQRIMDALNSGKKVLWCGNGGSAADCQHLSAELVARLNGQRRALASLALTTDTSYLTAWINDTGSGKELFSRQIEALGRDGDILMALSTSGESENILQAAKTAKQAGMTVIVLSGRDGGRLKALGDISLIVPSENTQRIQEMHILLGHILCESVENTVLSS